jgi:hypothetical protein
VPIATKEATPLYQLHATIVTTLITPNRTTHRILQPNFQLLAPIAIRKPPGSLQIMTTMGNISPFIPVNIKANGIYVPIAIQTHPITKNILVQALATYSQK